MKLKTFCGGLVEDLLPKGLRFALQEYDDLRDQKGWGEAERILDIRGDDLSDKSLGRLHRGCFKLTKRGLTLMARKYSHVCGQYVGDHIGDLSTLQGLFYWNGGDEFVTRILVNAWTKGK